MRIKTIAKHDEAAKAKPIHTERSYHIMATPTSEA